MSFIEDFPHTVIYDKDLGWLIRQYKELNDNYEVLKDIYNIVKEQIHDVTIAQLQEWLNDGTLENIINQQILGDINKKLDILLKHKIYHMKDYVVPNGNNDNTILMQQAINESAGNILIIDGNVFPYRCDQLLLKSNSIYILEDNTVIKANDIWVNTNRWQDPLIDIRMVSNVKIIGNGGTITMNKPSQLQTEHAHCLGTRGAVNVYVENINLTNASGDGFYIDQYDGDVTNKPSSFIEVKNVVCNNNGRNGLSLVSGHDITINSCVFKNTAGTAPNSGLDIEPELRTKSMNNILISDCHFISNKQQGLMVSLSKLQVELGLTVENCTMNDNRTNIYVENIKEGQKGYIIFNNCYMVNGHGSNLLDINNHYKGILRQYNNMYALNGNTDNATQTESSVGLVGWASNYQVCAYSNNSGNAIFNSCISVDDRETSQIETSFGLTQKELYQINNVRLIGCTSIGCKTSVLGLTKNIYNLLVDSSLDRNVINAYGTSDKFIDARNSHCLIEDGVVFLNQNTNKYAEVIMMNTKGEQANLKAGSGVNIIGKTNISLPNKGSFVHLYTLSGFTWFIKSSYDISIS